MFRMGIVLNADQIGEENDSTRISRHRKKKVNIFSSEATIEMFMWTVSCWFGL